VDIDYVQPPLGPGKQPAEHLMLLEMSGGERIHSDALRAFLTEFYTVLGLDDVRTDQLLRRAFAGRHEDAIPLTPLVRCIDNPADKEPSPDDVHELPELGRMQHAVLCYHFVDNPSDFAGAIREGRAVVTSEPSKAEPSSSRWGKSYPIRG
jgi:hypothetical protein